MGTKKSKDVFQFVENQKFSRMTMDVFKNQVENIEELKNLKNEICIYVTGSFGRLEASKFSDLDLFFIHSPSDEKKFSSISKTLIDAELIKISRNHKFPEFSGDGKYLQIHNLDHILATLGSPEDDFKNFFTARMLLLLESRPIFNEEVYNKTIKKLINAYFVDYHDHEENFKPVFLVNDILRFWRTLCLNYEHNRNLRSGNENEKRKAHLKNLKLKFSRMMTCFSAIIPIAQQKPPFSGDDLEKLVMVSPIERLTTFVTQTPKSKELISEILGLYDWFLNLHNQPREKLLDWIGNQGNKVNREEAFGKGRKFQEKVFELVETVAHKELMRYLVI